MGTLFHSLEPTALDCLKRMNQKQNQLCRFELLSRIRGWWWRPPRKEVTLNTLNTKKWNNDGEQRSNISKEDIWSRFRIGATKAQWNQTPRLMSRIRDWIQASFSNNARKWNTEYEYMHVWWKKARWRLLLEQIATTSPSDELKWDSYRT